MPEPLSASSTGPLLGIALDPQRRRGHELERQLRDRIHSGSLAPGTRLPSTRALADDLGVSRGVVVAAYMQLAAEGFIVTRRGAAACVADVRADDREAERPSRDVPVAEFRFNLRPDLPDLAAFPRGAWLRATRAALAGAADTDLAYGEPFGAHRLRVVLAPFLARTRGVVVEPSQLGITPGSTHALYVLAAALRAEGACRIGVEDPGHRWRRRTLASTGLDVVSIPVDERGLVPEELERAGVDAVVVSPDHAFPLGTALPPERRRALVEWARRNGTLVIEHDYDAQLRYDRPTAGALHALDREHVAYVGTASALLAPSARLGWVALPERLVVPVAGALADTTMSMSRITQHAFAEFVERGYLDRHLRRVRAAYKQRFAVVSSQLSTTGEPAGLYVRLPVADEAAALAAAADAGIALDGVQRNSMVEAPPGLVVGFAASSAPALEEALARLRQALP